MSSPSAQPPPPFVKPIQFSTGSTDSTATDHPAVANQFAHLQGLLSDSSSSESSSSSTTTTTTTSTSSSGNSSATGSSSTSSSWNSTSTSIWVGGDSSNSNNTSSWWSSSGSSAAAASALFIQLWGRDERRAMGGPLDMTVPELLKHWAEYRRDQPALIFRHPNNEEIRTVLTYGDLYTLGGRCAAMLRHRGVVRETSVLIFLPNCPERAILEAGALLLGAFAITGICNESDGSDLVALARQSYAKVIVLDTDVHQEVWLVIKRLCPLHDPITDNVTSVRMPDLHAVLRVKRQSEPVEDERDFMCYVRDVYRREYHLTPAPFPHHPCVVLQTAGAEGRLPKLVVHTHRNIVAFSKIFMPRTDSPRPMYFLNHPFGTVRGHLAVSLCNPVTRILLDELCEEAESLPTSIYKALLAEKCPIAALSPSVVPDLAATFLRDPENTFRLSFVGFIGEEVSHEAMMSVFEFSHTAIVSYVSAELLLVAISLYAEPAPNWGCGQVVQPGIFIDITDDAGNHVNPEVRGQMLIRTPLMFKGYLNSPKATAACMTPGGYFKTGDLAQMIDNYLYLNPQEIVCH